MSRPVHLPMPSLPPRELVPDVPNLWAAHQERMVPHTMLVQVLDTAAEYAQDTSVLKGNYLQQQFDDFTEAVRSVPGYKGVFGTGYPFYALRPDGGTYDVPEITRYTRSFISEVQKDAQRNYGAWICGACQVETDLPDLKTYCKPCKQVDFKPRDIFKALPDLDFWVIVDPETETLDRTEEIIRDRVEAAGFYASDSNVSQAVDSTLYVMRTLQRGHMPSARLPLDLHVVTKQEILACINEAPRALAQGETIPISPRSLHVRWEDTDEPYDFLKDFLFSLTAQDWQDEDLWRSLRDARHSAKSLVGDDIVQAVAERAPKEARQLESPEIQQCLRNRIAEW